MIATRSGGWLLDREGNPVTFRGWLNSADLHIAAHGDSMTRDRGDAAYIYQLARLIKSEDGLNAAVTQRGINGSSFGYAWSGEPYTGTLIDHAPIAIDPRIRAGMDNWLIVWAGINGMALGGHSAAAEYDDCKTYLSARITAGWQADKIIVCTMTPRAGFTDSIREDFNALIVGDGDDLGYQVARIDLNTNIGQWGDQENTTYFYDGVHMTDAGHGEAAAVIYGVMFPA